MSTISNLLGLVTLVSILTSVPTLIASVGLILATASFISGLQLVKTTAIAVEGKIHRANGIVAICLYIALFIISIFQNGLSWSIPAWLLGLGVILLKISIVRKRRRRTFKYVNWLGGTIFLIWLYVVWVHLPV
ncbi:MAG: hypothetical protein HY894_02530 [Deltaproteobacteria bacterium]|nr:hypothetical protein [Deltaproteobacteria bacterium]